MFPLSTGKSARPSKRQFAAVLAMGISGVLSCAALADGPFVRELDAYCVTTDGTRSGVAASQDGATNGYIWQPGSDIKITRGVHNRRTVSEWHKTLDQAGFNTLSGSDVSAPYCAIERVEQGKSHTVRWAEDSAPEPLEAVFAAMLATRLPAGLVAIERVTEELPAGFPDRVGGPILEQARNRMELLTRQLEAGPIVDR